jgi:hypothetical protein
LSGWNRLFVIVAVCWALAALFLPLNVAAQNADVSSGNYFLRPCRAYLASRPTTNDLLEAYDQGVCTGAIKAVFHLGRHLAPDRRFCPPRGATEGQAARVTLGYIEARPDRLHEEFVFLAIEALHKAWPCR